MDPDFDIVLFCQRPGQRIWSVWRQDCELWKSENILLNRGSSKGQSVYIEEGLQAGEQPCALYLVSLTYHFGYYSKQQYALNVIRGGYVAVGWRIQSVVQGMKHDSVVLLRYCLYMRDFVASRNLLERCSTFNNRNSNKITGIIVIKAAWRHY